MRLFILAFASGILLLQQFSELPPVWPWVVAGTFLGLVTWLVGPAGWRGRLLGVLACALLGTGWAAWRAELRLADVLLPAWEGRDIELTGVIAEMPQPFSHGTRFRFSVESVATPGAVVPGEIMLSWYQGRQGDEVFAERTLRPGERWQLTVRLKRPHGNANPHAFDYELWLFERGIRATGYVRPQGGRRLEAMVWRPGTVIERTRDAIRERFQQLLPGDQNPYAGILTALAIGDQRAIQGEDWNTFNRTGTTHLMSISGLHVTMVAALLAWLTGHLWRRSSRLLLWCPAPRAAILAGWLAALIYTLLAGYGVPAQRTFYMLSIAAFALYSGRNPGASRILLLALLVVLLIDPWAILAAGFWLSFGAVAVLLYVGLAMHRDDDWRSRILGWGRV
ncbi:MAG TPA: ComEC/Rec2 family competence protein, partial [Rhodocyclaceae bacterium]|nr:ComEC/Rec2 family competence protein [Rhodocyclaceae bacterium]